MEFLPIDQQSCDPQMVPLCTPGLNHLVLSSHTSSSCHNISYDVQILSGYFHGPPDLAFIFLT